MKRPRAQRLLLDTHIWIWYVAGSGDLPPSLRAVLDDSLGSCWLSPISMWELAVLYQKGRVRLKKRYRTWIEHALEVFPVQQAPLEFEVAQRVYELNLPHGDPADHLLAATALSTTSPWSP